MKETILTGIRSNDEPTLGNYLGAFLPMVELQKQKAGQFQVNMFVPDLHSFTTPIEHADLYQNTLKNLKYFVAAGLDINQPDTFIYRQSFISAHSELTWILDCFTGIGEMERMTQYKDKSRKIYSENSKFYNEQLSGEHNWEDMKLKQAEVIEVIGPRVSVGLFNYPVLMAADILLYQAKWVPVGEDQRQHLEITRDIGQRMNAKFGQLFTVPEDWTKQLDFAQLDRGVRIRSLSDPTRKMSKSIADPKGTILLSDEPKVAAKKVMSATTDSLAEINFDWDKQPGVTNLLQILSLLTRVPQEKVNTNWQGQNSYGELKKAVATAIEQFLTDFQTKYSAVDEASLLSKLETDEAVMGKVANQTLLKVQQAVGLRTK